ncbi:hypothetical protein JCM5296_002029 [Sporobolomyces johnsonii]
MADTATSQPSTGAAWVFSTEKLLSPAAFVRQLDELATRHAKASAEKDPASETLLQELRTFVSQKKMHLRESCVDYRYEGDAHMGTEYSSVGDKFLNFALMSPSSMETTRHILTSVSALKLDQRSFKIKNNAVVQLNGHIGLAQGLVTPLPPTQEGESFKRVAYTLGWEARTSGYGSDRKPVRVYAPDLILGIKLALRGEGAGSYEATLVYESGAFFSGTKMCEMGLSRF